MSENYYRTGQAAKQLEASSYQIRRLCECGLIDAELTTGKQWRIPASEVARLKREGVPPVPQLLREAYGQQEEPTPVRVQHESNRHLSEEPEDVEDGDPDDPYGPPSEEVVRSAEDVTITENLLKKRKLERDFEEVEDFFREREQKRQAELSAQRARAAEIQARNRRREWQDRWVTYGLQSIPWGAPKEVELQVQETVEDGLAKLDPDQPEYLVRRLVDAAVQKGLVPWRHEENRKKALETAISDLPWAMKYTQEFADLKQQALQLATEALESLKPDAADWVMRESAKQAVQTAVQEYRHREACKQALASIRLPGATAEELEDAQDTARKAIAALPIGASLRQLEKARDAAVAPIQSTIGEREEQRKRQTQQEIRKFGAELRVDIHLRHIETYLGEEFEFDGGYAELSREADRIRPVIRKRLVRELTDNPTMDSEEIRAWMEELIDELVR